MKRPGRCTTKLGHHQAELDNLRTDPNEEHDLAATMPDKAVSLNRTLQAWQSETSATISRNVVVALVFHLRAEQKKQRT